eukprot:351375-Chlamydomonas_euryale.AAC.20
MLSHLAAHVHTRRRPRPNRRCAARRSGRNASREPAGAAPQLKLLLSLRVMRSAGQHQRLADRDRLPLQPRVAVAAA